jgi:hypothetical protein
MADHDGGGTATVEHHERPSQPMGGATKLRLLSSTELGSLGSSLRPVELRTACRLSGESERQAVPAVRGLTAAPALGAASVP